jgi:hypothetical protein
MAMWIDVQPPHQTVLRAQLARLHRLLNPSRGQDPFAVPLASTEIELTELDHVRRAKPQQAAGGVQARRIGTPVETGQPIVSGIG